MARPPLAWKTSSGRGPRRDRPPRQTERLGIHSFARRLSWKRRAARWLGLLAAPFLAGGCFLLPPAEFAQLAPPPRYDAGLSSFRYPGVTGQPIEGFLALPAGSSAPDRVPCLLLLHGQIGFWRSYEPHALQLARLGYGVLYINYYSARLVNLKEGTRPFRERVERLRLLLEDMAHGVDALAAHPRCDPGGVTVVGFSLGGSYAFHVAALRPRKVAAIVSFYGGYRFLPLMDTWDIRLSYFFADEDGRRWHEWFARQDPQSLLGKVRAPVLLLHGRKDTWIPHRQAEEYHRELKSRGIPAELVLLPEANHDFMFSFNTSSGQRAIGHLAHFLEQRVVASFRMGCSPGGYGALPPCPKDAPPRTALQAEENGSSPMLRPASSPDPTPRGGPARRDDPPRPSPDGSSESSPRRR